MIHKELASGRWFQLSLAEQLGNVGSEYERAISWKMRRDQEQFNNSFERYLELLDLTISDPRYSVARKRELLRVREVSCEELLGEVQNRELGAFKDFFYYFMLAARGSR